MTIVRANPTLDHSITEKNGGEMLSASLPTGFLTGFIGALLYRKTKNWGITLGGAVFVGTIVWASIVLVFIALGWIP